MYLSTMFPWKIVGEKTRKNGWVFDARDWDAQETSMKYIILNNITYFLAPKRPPQKHLESNSRKETHVKCFLIFFIADARKQRLKYNTFGKGPAQNTPWGTHSQSLYFKKKLSSGWPICIFSFFETILWYVISNCINIRKQPPSTNIQTHKNTLT